jgi:hypothetical protein
MYNEDRISCQWQKRQKNHKVFCANGKLFGEMKTSTSKIIKTSRRPI